MDIFNFLLTRNQISKQSSMFPFTAPIITSVNAIVEDIVCNFTEPSETGSGTVTDYVIELWITNGVNYGTFSLGIAVPSEFSISNATGVSLQLNVNYSFRLKAINDQLENGAWSAIHSATPLEIPDHLPVIISGKSGVWYFEDNPQDSYEGLVPIVTGNITYSTILDKKFSIYNGSSYIDTLREDIAGGLHASSNNKWSIFIKFWMDIASSGTLLSRCVAPPSGRTFHLNVSSAGDLNIVLRSTESQTIVSDIEKQSVHTIGIAWDGLVAKTYFNGDFIKNISAGTVNENVGKNIMIGTRDQDNVGFILSGGRIGFCLITDRTLTEDEFISLNHSHDRTSLTPVIKSFQSNSGDGQFTINWNIA